MVTPVPNKGPLFHRIVVNGFSVLFSLLLFWLIGFVLSDIGRWERPDFETLQDEFIPQELVDEQDNLNKEKERLELQIRHQQESQEILQTSMNSSEQTMKQFLEIHRLSLEKGIQPTEEQQRALSDSESLYLENQRKFQDANQQVAQLRSSMQTIEDQLEEIKTQLDEKRIPLNEEYNRLRERNRFIVAAVKLAVLIPVLLVIAWLVKHKKGTTYAPLYYAAFVAVLSHTLLVMHQYFPKEFFKYLILAAAIVVVMMLLVHMIRLAASPKRDWLLKRYKEAYRKRICPVCSMAIEKGSLKFMPNPLRFAPVQSPQEHSAEAYTCPACGTALFEECGQCHTIRHSLLPHCEGCGAEKEINVPV
jgi:hypothetical protein